MKTIAACLFLALLSHDASRAAEPIDASRFEKEVLVSGGADPLQLDVALDGRVFFIERKGVIKMCDPSSRRTVVIGDFPANYEGDAGALGLALAQDFAKSGHLYTIRVPAEGEPRLVVARYTLSGEKLGEERVVLSIPLRREREQYHCGAGLAWDHRGNLLIGVGDNMPPQDVPAIHSEDTSRDARGTAGNSQELRGKVLRITPQPDGSYTVPQGNLFPEGTSGRPEIFAFGVRNPFRVACDAKTGLIVWGDVGGNVRTEFELGPEGFDEINATMEPGFFGWPFCSGPNLPWRPFDPKTQKPAGDFFVPEKLINESKINTGLRELPPSKPAAFYYGNMPSKEWPFVGSGGRSLTGGVFYHKPSTATDGRLPDEWEGAYLFGEWMRNWMALARFDEKGQLTQVDRILSGVTFKRPADFKIGPDGALYVAECGNQWTGNTASQITRITYRRGNRLPQALATVSRSAGKLPLEVSFDATGSIDVDGEALKASWDFGDGQSAEGKMVKHTFATVGSFPVTLKVTDPQGGIATTTLVIAAGNEAPEVAFSAPLDGSFIEGKEILWKVGAKDAEEGQLPAERLLLQLEKRDRAALDDSHPGLALMKRTTCFACHNATEKSAGPPYAAVAAKYAADDKASELLAKKVVSGGVGVWGNLPMPPHPQHTVAEASQMVDWVLSLAQRKITTLAASSEGNASVPENPRGWGRADNTVIFLTATTSDNGANALPPLRGSAEVQLRSRRQRAACFDQAHNALAQDNLDQGGLVARLQADGWIAFDRIRLQEVKAIKLSGWPQGSAPIKLSLLAGDKRLAEQELPTGPASSRRPSEFTLRLPAFEDTAAPQQLRIKIEGSQDGLLDLMWVDFLKE